MLTLHPHSLRAVKTLFVMCVVALAGGCVGPGNLEEVKPFSEAPRAGSVYLIRGWVGVFSSGIDTMGRTFTEQGITSRVFQHDQCEELARTMAQRYKSARDPEPICMIGHSYGADDSLIIARELDKVGVPVDLIVTLDPVDQTTVPKNVRLCVNYWQKGIFGNSNFLRGIPLKQEPGARGKLLNVNLFEEGRELREFDTTHINIDKGEKIHKAILEHVLATCPPREAWVATHRPRPDLAAVPLGSPARDAQRRPSYTGRLSAADTESSISR